VYIFREDHGRLVWIGLLSILMRFLYIITGRVISMVMIFAVFCLHLLSKYLLLYVISVL